MSSTESFIRSKSPPKSVTRYGVIHSPIASIGKEERFAGQQPQFGSDVIYNLPDAKMTRVITFGSSQRLGMDDVNPDTKKRSTGPGSYDPTRGYPHLSEYPHRTGNRFASAPRQSMALKTPSPGAVYDISNQYWNGPVKTLGIGFNRDSRQQSFGNSMTADADMLWPKLPRGPSITIAGRLNHKEPGAGGPGPIYDVHKKVNFKTGPAFSFGRGRSDRFSAINHLSEIDD